MWVVFGRSVAGVHHDGPAVAGGASAMPDVPCNGTSAPNCLRHRHEPQRMLIMHNTCVQAVLRVRSEQKPLRENVTKVLCGASAALFLVLVIAKLALARALGPSTLWADLRAAAAVLAFAAAGAASTAIRSSYPRFWATDSGGALAVAAGILAVAAVVLARLRWWRSDFWVQRLSHDEASVAAPTHLDAAARIAEASPAAGGPQRPGTAIGKWGGGASGGAVSIPPLPQFVQAGVQVQGAVAGGAGGSGAPPATASTTFDEPTTGGRSPPKPGASTEDRLDFIQHQLDGFGTVMEILEGLRLVGLGPSCRLQGGVPPAVSAAPARRSIHMMALLVCTLREPDSWRTSWPPPPFLLCTSLLPVHVSCFCVVVCAVMHGHRWTCGHTCRCSMQQRAGRPDQRSRN